MSNINIETAREAVTRSVAEALAYLEYDGEIHFDVNYAEEFPNIGTVLVGVDTDEGLLTFNVRVSNFKLEGEDL